MAHERPRRHVRRVIPTSLRAGNTAMHDTRPITRQKADRRALKRAHRSQRGKRVGGVAPKRVRANDHGRRIVRPLAHDRPEKTLRVRSRFLALCSGPSLLLAAAESPRHGVRPLQTDEKETSMASRRRLEERFAFASRAVHHHRLRRRRSWRSSRAAPCWPRSPSTAWGMRGAVPATRATCGTASTRPTPMTRRTRSSSIRPCSARRRRSRSAAASSS